jgi:hypothetical protein
MKEIKYHVGSMYWPCIKSLVNFLNDIPELKFEELNENDSKYIMIKIPERYDEYETALYIGTLIGHAESDYLNSLKK